MSTSLTRYRDKPNYLPIDHSSPEHDSDTLTVSYVLQQHPISVTLSGPAIFTLCTALVLVIHFTGPYSAELVLALAPFLLFIQNDYQNFLNLGPGGTPSTFTGYIRITWLRLWTLRDPFSPPGPDPTLRPKHGILSREPLPYRAGPRPTVAGIAPQRQLDQVGTLYHYRALRRTIENLSAADPMRFGTACSCFEKHGLALFARHSVNRTCQGEICHVHHSDHSMHMNLHPDDIKEVLEKGWGQRHPLACKGWFGPMPVSEKFMMIYGPRDELELAIVCRIIEAAIWYVTAEAAKMDVASAE